jgi:SAM-dependent methyltransferase
MDDTFSDKWNDAYHRGDNFVFYPNEFVIRFTARFLRKQIGLHRHRAVADRFRDPIPVLDLGCGIGRHVVFAHQMGMLASGIELSEVAVELAKTWAREVGGDALAERIVQGDVRRLPWPDGAFDAVISHGVLDSMPAEVAEATLPEVARVLSPGGLFYVDLISGDDSRHAPDFAGDEVVAGAHEEGTIQSYFNFARIDRMFSPWFEFLDVTLARNQNVLGGTYKSRYHCTLRKRA